MSTTADQPGTHNARGTTIDARLDGPVSTVTLNPSAARDGLDEQWLRDFEAMLDDLGREPDLRVVVVRAEGRDSCRGIDRHGPAAGKRAGDFFRRWEEALRRIEAMEPVVICAVHSHCTGGELDLALACDLRIARDDARLGATAVEEGIVPGTSVWRVARYAGMGRAKRLMLTGEVIEAREALAWGLVDYVASADAFEARIGELTNRVLAMPRTPARLTKSLTNMSFDLSHAECLEVSCGYQRIATQSDEYREAKKEPAPKITFATIREALHLSDVEAAEEERKGLVEAANANLARYEELRRIHVPNDVSPPFHFSPMVPGLRVNRTRLPFTLSAVPPLERPMNLEEVAFWPVRHLAELIRTRQVSSVELTEMYLARLHRFQPRLNNVVTFLDEHGLAEAKRADAEIAAGRYKGPLHGIPWGAKDVISVKGFRTTWGSPAFEAQSFDYDASVVEMLRDAGAVLIAKLSTGELAAGDNWFGGHTKNPWDPTQGSSGSSAGPSSATAAGGVAFGIGTETTGSILYPAARCGLTGLRPTFGRVSRHGVMVLAWTQDRVGPLCRYAEDCAIVMQAIARPDDRDMSVTDLPFNWNADLDIRTLRVGYVKESFDELTNEAAMANAAATLATLTSLGVGEIVPVSVPDFPFILGGMAVESAAFFDEHARAGRMKNARGGGRVSGRLVPAVEYLSAQRIRTMMMTMLAAATSHVDVYIVASNNNGLGGPGPRPAGNAPNLAPLPPLPPLPEPPRTPAARNFMMASLAGYPAVNLPNGFSETGSPTNAVLYAQPYREMELLALAKAYQDKAGFHLERPSGFDSGLAITDSRTPM